MKGDIHSYVFSTSSFLCDIRKLRYRQNKIGYQIIKIVNNRLIPYSWNMMPCIVLLVSWPTNVTEKTACTQMKGGIPRYVFSISSPLCDIGELRYRQNNTEYQILWIINLYLTILIVLYPVLFCINRRSLMSHRKLIVFKT